MIMFVLLLLMSIALITVGQRILPIFFTKIHFYNSFVVLLINILRWVIVIFALMIAMSLLYYFGNPRAKKFKLFTPGSFLFTGMFIVGTILFNFYISNISTYNLLYGSIGGLIIFVIWIYFNCILILIGYELNKSIAKAQDIVFTFPDIKQIEDKNKSVGCWLSLGRSGSAYSSAVGLSAISLLAPLSLLSQRMPLQSLTQRGEFVQVEPV